MSDISTSLTLVDGAGQAVLDAINEQFSAFQSTFSGDSPPALTVGGMLWNDTLNKRFKLRSQDNTKWITLPIDLETGSIVGYEPGDIINTTIVSSSVNTGDIVALTGDVSGSGEFNEAGNVSIETTLKDLSTIYEPVLGNPSTDGYVLSSTSSGTRSWVQPASGAAWGSITGTLSAQTDLQTELDTKIIDAPSDGNEYVRVNGGWSLNTGGSALPDAASDGVTYGRRDGAWSEVIDTLGGQAISGSLAISGLISGNIAGTGSLTLRTNDNDFILQDTTSTSSTNYVWRDYSAGRLYLGNTTDAIVSLRSSILANLHNSYDIGSDLTRFKKGYFVDLSSSGTFTVDKIVSNTSLTLNGNLNFNGALVCETLASSDTSINVGTENLADETIIDGLYRFGGKTNWLGTLPNGNVQNLNDYGFLWQISDTVQPTQLWFGGTETESQIALRRQDSGAWGAWTNFLHDRGGQTIKGSITLSDTNPVINYIAASGTGNGKNWDTVLYAADQSFRIRAQDAGNTAIVAQHIFNNDGSIAFQNNSITAGSDSLIHSGGGQYISGTTDFQDVNIRERLLVGANGSFSSTYNTQFINTVTGVSGSAYYQRTMYIKAESIPSDWVDNTTYPNKVITGLVINALNQKDASAVDIINTLHGQQIQYGQYTGANTTTITNAFGLQIIPYVTEGTVTNLYDLYLSAQVAGGTVTKHYGIYQVESGIENYIGGFLDSVGGYKTRDGRVDLDTITATNNYWAGGGVANNPSGKNGGVYHLDHDTGGAFATQFFVGHNSGLATGHIRAKDNGTWGSWRELIHNAGGQTINGDLTLNGNPGGTNLVISAASGQNTAAIKWTNIDNSVYLRSNTGGTLELYDDTFSILNFSISQAGNLYTRNNISEGDTLLSDKYSLAKITKGHLFSSPPDGTGYWAKVGQWEHTGAYSHFHGHFNVTNRYHDSNFYIETSVGNGSNVNFLASITPQSYGNNICDISTNVIVTTDNTSGNTICELWVWNEGWSGNNYAHLENYHFHSAVQWNYWSTNDQYTTTTQPTGVTETILVTDDIIVTGTIDGSVLKEAGTALSSKYLGINAKAQDSNLLDGLDYSQFIRSDTNDVASGNHEFYATNTSGIYSESAIEIREVGLVTTNQSSDAYAPALAFHWGGRVQNQIALEADGKFHFRDGGTLVTDASVEMGSLTPGADNTYSIGTSSLRWSNVESIVFTENGSALSSKYLGITSNAVSATKLATARTIDITGDITANAVTFDGTANIAISASVNDDSHNHTSVSGDFTIGGNIFIDASEGIYFENKKHAITWNDGTGNFNIRVGNIDTSGEVSTETGYAFHQEYAQSTGQWQFNVSSTSLNVGDPVSWRQQLLIDPNAVTLRYQGGNRLSSTSAGATVYGNLEINNTAPKLILKDNNTTGASDSSIVMQDTSGATKGQITMYDGSSDIVIQNYIAGKGITLKPASATTGIVNVAGNLSVDVDTDIIGDLSVANVSLPDEGILRLGGVLDSLSIWHSSSTNKSLIFNYTGSIEITQSVSDGTGYLKAANTAGTVKNCLSWGNGSSDEPSVSLLYDDIEKLKTTSTGASISGDLFVSGSVTATNIDAGSTSYAVNEYASFNNKLRIYGTASHSYLDNQSTGGNMYIRNYDPSNSIDVYATDASLVTSQIASFNTTNVTILRPFKALSTITSDGDLNASSNLSVTGTSLLTGAVTLGYNTITFGNPTVTARLLGNGGHFQTQFSGIYYDIWDSANSAKYVNSTSGEQKLASGLLLKWMEVASTSDANQTFSWPTTGFTPFTAVYGSWSGGHALTGNADVFVIDSWTNTSVTVNRGDATNGTVNIIVFALGAA